MGAPNVVLVIFDTMRRDALRAYGGTSATPNFDAFCAESVVYNDCIAPSPWTIPSHASLFLGKYPGSHGVHETETTKAVQALTLMMNAEGEPLAELLRKKGYETAGLSGNSMLTTVKGFDRGFGSFEGVGPQLIQGLATVWQALDSGKTKGEILKESVFKGDFRRLWRLYTSTRKIQDQMRRMNYPASKGGDALIRSLEGRRLAEPFFLFLNFFEMHEPYTPFEMRRANFAPFGSPHLADTFGYRKIPEAVIPELKQGYAAAAARLDAYFGEVVARLKSWGVYDSSMIVVTSDHGQAFKEHGFYTHGTFLYDELVEIPLVVKYPRGARPEARPGYQNLLSLYQFIARAGEGDVAPDSLTAEETFSESFGTQYKPPQVQDRGLAEKFEEVRVKIDRPRRAMYRGGYKLVLDCKTMEPEEFTFRKAPAARSENPDVFGEMKESLIRLAERAPAGQPAPASLTPEEEADIAERLKVLGYA